MPNATYLKTIISIFPLGDAAITVDLGDQIDEGLNNLAIALAARLRQTAIDGVLDILVAYSSVSVFYDPCRLRQKALLEKVRAICGQTIDSQRSATVPAFEPIRIPVCYAPEFAPDLAAMAEEKGVPAGELVRLHLSRIYKVYMIGFLPGFPYLGTLDPQIAFPRKRSPVPVRAGAVGIAGNQTGIYPVDSPGGWQIIGRTPFPLFHPNAENPIRLKPGDLVEFVQIDPDRFRDLSSVPASASFKTISDPCRS